MATLQPGDIAARVGLDAQLVHRECEEAGLPFLADFVHPWKENFFFLLPRVDVDDVEAENCGRTEKEKRVAALLKWKARCGKEATYSALLSALLENGNVERAEALCQHLLRRTTLEKEATLLTPPPSTSPQPTTSTTSAPPQATPTPSPVRTFGEPSCGLEVQIEQLDEQYINLESLTLETIKERKVPLDKVLNWVRFLPIKLRSQFASFLKSNAQQLSSTKSVDELFSILSSYWNMFHPDLLQHIVNKIEVQALKAQMDRYIANLHHFRVHTTLGDFMDKWIGDIPAGYTEFVLELGEKWRERTVEDLNQFQIRFSRLQCFGGNYVPMLKTAKSSSILVVLALPRQVFPLNFTQKDLVTFLRGEDVLRVTVGGQCLLDLVQLVEYERQLLQLCRQGGEVKDLSHLLSQPGVSPNNFDEYGQTPLWLASEHGFVEFVQVLLKYGADVNLPTNDDFGGSPLIIAASNGHTATCEVLLDHGANADFQLKEGASPLYYACFEDHLDIVKLLLSRGASVDLPRDDGCTPLYVASYHGHLAVVESLLDKGATVDLPNKGGTTPLFIASQEGHTAIVEMLVLKGANVDQPMKDGVTPLMMACFNGHLEVANVLVKGASINLQREDGRTALMWASLQGHQEIVGQLLTAGAAPDIQDEDGLTALMLATQSGHLGVVSALLQGGANPNITEKDSGWSGLHFSAKEGQTEMTKLLLDRGADASLKDKTGVTPYQLAKLHHNEDICSMLNNYYNTTKEIAVTEEQEKQVKSFSQRIRGVLRSLKATLLSNRTEKEQKQKSIRKVATSESDKERVTAVVKSH